MGEVKNMENVGGPADLELGVMVEKAKALGDLLRDNAALLSALISAYNGGRLPGGLELFYGGAGVDISRVKEDFDPGGVRRRGRREKDCGVCV